MIKKWESKRKWGEISLKDRDIDRMGKRDGLRENQNRNFMIRKIWHYSLFYFTREMDFAVDLLYCSKPQIWIWI